MELVLRIPRQLTDNLLPYVSDFILAFISASDRGIDELNISIIETSNPPRLPNKIDCIRVPQFAPLVRPRLLFVS